MKDIKLSIESKKKVRNYNTNSFMTDNTHSDINVLSLGLSTANEMISKTIGPSFKKNLNSSEKSISGTNYKKYSSLLSSSKIKKDEYKTKRKDNLHSGSEVDKCNENKQNSHKTLPFSFSKCENKILTEKFCSESNSYFTCNQIPSFLKNEKYCNSERKSNQPSKFSIELTSQLTSTIPIELSNLDLEFPNFDSSKVSNFGSNYVKAYSENTNQGTVRKYNEDRISVYLELNKPSCNNSDKSSICSFFAIYDGHGGSGCADFLKDNLHNYIINEPSFPSNPVEAIKKACEKAESYFINNIALNPTLDQIIDKSGSCALFAIFLNDEVYIGNVGDSRAFLSSANGDVINSITIDHKPNEVNEMKRILSNGGKVYQARTSCRNQENNGNKILLGPHRVSPGRLSVSRTFGDVEAKLSKFGGIEGVVVAYPDIFKMKIREEMDFILLGCDGMYDQMSNKELTDCIFKTFETKSKTFNFHTQCGMAMDMIIKTSLARKSLDNVTGILIALENLEKHFNRMEKPFVTNSLFKKFKTNKALKSRKEEGTKKIQSKLSFSKNSDKSRMNSQTSNYNCSDLKLDKDKKNMSYENILLSGELKTKDFISKNFSTDKNFVEIKKNYKPSIVINLQLNEGSEGSQLNKPFEKDFKAQKNLFSCKNVYRSYIKLN